MNYLIKIQYDGSKFNGFQRLNKETSVQKTIEDALSKIDKQRVMIKGAGRTDRGVHALDQAASFKLKNNVPPERLLNAINSIVFPYIRITSCQEVKEDFHARFNVKYKEYTYIINTGEMNPLDYDYMLFSNDVKIKKIKKAAKLFLGGHDFTNFVSGKREESKMIIDKIKISKVGDLIYIVFTGKSFYRYMVRNLVGAMLDYNYDRVSLKEIKEMLSNIRVQKQLSTAKASGLYLSRIEY